MKLELDEETTTSINNSNTMLKKQGTLGLIGEKIEESVELEMNIEKDTIIKKDDFFGKTVSKSSKTIRKFGNTCTLCFNKDGDPRIIIGPHCIFI